MLSPTLQQGLGEYGIGAKIRSLRLKKKMGLVQLGEHTGLSPAMLSKIERGRLFPTLPTLLRVALVFSVGLEFFFGRTLDQPLVAVVRKRQRVRLPDRPGVRDVAFTFESLDYPATERRFNSYLAGFAATTFTRPHAHPGVEFIYALQGSLAVQVGNDEHVLQQGDSMYFDSSAPHAYARRSARDCSAIVVTAP